MNFRVRLQSDYAINNAITVPLKLFSRSNLCILVAIGTICALLAKDMSLCGLYLANPFYVMRGSHYEVSPRYCCAFQPKLSMNATTSTFECNNAQIIIKSGQFTPQCAELSNQEVIDHLKKGYSSVNCFACR